MIKDLYHDDAMAEIYRRDPMLAEALFNAIEADGNKAELAIIKRQIAKSAKLPHKDDSKKQ
ncbi:hypothetical protein PS662_01120 [Pseudomonas fluorescens]|uniref:Uncharacterized protein n=1 Tax=Pseudomonas fluorescens TaxID=294 RepID=A0A5E6QM86_PSEFL|nr:hypothetical protein [Pseudomonas fluorescens]VVM57304.1 hypothetical protein PS662_01120 [Pseudomonas fluorescens]